MAKILLIDDEADILRVLSRSLRADGYDVVTASNGKDALETFRAESPEIVLTDIKMPEMDGLEVLRQVKEIDADAQVIIITGHGDIDSAVEALQYGASDFINKPVRDEALNVALKRAEEKLKVRSQLKAYTEDLETMVQIATQEFERKSNFQAKLIRSSNDGIIATDENWNIVIFNPSAERIFGYTKAKVVRRVRIQDLFPAEVMESLSEEAASDSREREFPWIETEILARDGTSIPVRFYGTVLRERQRMMGSVAFFQDLRDIKRLEAELLASERLAAIGQTVAGLAHCIKNILHGFKGGSYLVNVGIDKNNDDKLKNGWQMIQRNIQRTSDLVLDLLSYSKEREPEYQPCTPNEIAGDVCDLFQEHAEDYDIEIVTDFSPDIGQVYMDPRTVHRCLMNLVTNAIDACIFDESVGKDHRVHVSTRKENGEWIAFRVEDNGSGMPEEVREKLFSSFFSTKGAKGTGLGLLVTGKLIEEHKGTIDVESAKGQGTTFTIRFPFQSVSPADG
ncbi:MAG: response regulator [Desulfobacteraceae bacterium]|jgi:PAS domain S-box-containing protein|nr:response regulator [Desulfobacteraceae bacterium]